MNIRPRHIPVVLTAALLSVNSALLPARAQFTHTQQDTGKQHNKQLALIQGSGSGTLSATTSKGKALGTCPLKHTDVKADVSGFVARVTVKQIFENPFKDKIEAVYTFPLPDSAAVDQMTMKVGNRVIHGTIKKREEARQIYDAARQAGQVASLLDQERTNIFTQSVANIEPGAKIEITLNYVDVLPYEDGSFTFAFPTVVGPRFMPGQPLLGQSGTGRSMNTDAVPDASRISPPVAAERAGHDISMDVHIDAGVPIDSTTSQLHEVDIKKMGAQEEEVSLKDKAAIPNKDFVLSWHVAAANLQSGYLVHKDGKSGYFTLMIMPPKRVAPSEAQPKEMIFLIDCSGSQSGAPLQKAKETMTYVLNHMNPNDTFQVISFSDHLLCFPEKPAKASKTTVEQAHAFIDGLQANGGTWMAPAVAKACSLPNNEHRLRIVTFMTDGYVGNDFEIIGMVKKFRGQSRWFPFGTGNSVNRMLIDGIAKEGGGEPDYVLLNSSGETVGKKFYERISSPVLTDVKVEFNGLPVKEVFPKEVSDVWAQRPLYITGRYTAPASGTITISGFSGGKPYRQDLKVVFPGKQPQNEVLGSIWARKKVDRLMSEDYTGAQSGSINKELKEEIIQTALEHHILTQYTSFVAVEEKKVTKGGASRLVPVEVEQPDGVSREMTGTAGGIAAMPAPARAWAGAAGGSAAFPVKSKAMARHARNFQQSFGLAAPPVVAQGYGSARGWNAPPPPLPAVNSLVLKQQSLQAPTQMDALVSPPAANTGGDDEQEERASSRQRLTGADKKSAEPLFSAAKFDQALVKLIAQAEKQPGGLQASTDKVRVRITLTSTNAAVLQTIKKLGAVINVQSDKSVIAQVPVNMLRRLSRLADVVSIARHDAGDVKTPAHPSPAPLLPAITGQLPTKSTSAKTD